MDEAGRRHAPGKTCGARSCLMSTSHRSALVFWPQVLCKCSDALIEFGSALGAIVRRLKAGSDKAGYIKETPRQILRPG